MSMNWKLITLVLAFALFAGGTFANTGYNAYYYTNNYKPSVYYSDPYQASASNYAYASTAYPAYGYAYNNVYSQNLAYNTYANNYRTNAMVTYSPINAVATYPTYYYPNYSAYYGSNYYPNYSSYYYPNYYPNYYTTPIGGYTGFSYYNANNGWGFSITRGNVCAIYGYC